MRNIVSLIEDHDAVDALADRLIVSARPGQASANACLALMAQLAGMLERLLTPAATISTGAPNWPALPFAEQIEGLQAELAELSEHWDSYLAHWSEAQIDAQRSRYSGETTDLMTVFKLRLAQDLGAPIMTGHAG